MTDHEKQTIERLRAKGLTYGDISVATGIKVATLKTYFARAKQAISRETVSSQETQDPREIQNPYATASAKAPNVPKVPIAPNTLVSALVTPLTGTCKICGNELIHTPGKMRKTYCSNACRQKHAYEARKTRVLPFTRICPVCGKKFTVLRSSKKKYCSQECFVNDRFYR